MKETKPTDTDSMQDIDLHPRHESWVRISTHNNLIGIVIFLALAAFLVIVIDLHFSPAAIAAVGIVVALLLLGLIWRSTPQRRRGFLGNVGLTVRIKADLMTELGANDVNVDSSKGVVTLHGTVPYTDFREAAGHLARQQGAHQVINELTVDASVPRLPDSPVAGIPGVTTSEGALEVARQPSLEERVREALEYDPRVRSQVLIVRVEDGIAYLTGRQETTQASDAATEVAAHVPGILGVSNDIEILPSV